MRKAISILTIFAFLFMTFASGDSSSDTLKAGEAKCDVCKNKFNKSDAWDYDITLYCATYVKRSSGIFCSRSCAQKRAIDNGKTSCN